MAATTWAGTLELEERHLATLRSSMLHYDNGMVDLSYVHQEICRRLMVPNTVNVILTVPVASIPWWDSSKTVQLGKLLNAISESNSHGTSTMVALTTVFVAKGPLAPDYDPADRAAWIQTQQHKHTLIALKSIVDRGLQDRHNEWLLLFEDHPHLVVVPAKSEVELRSSNVEFCGSMDEFHDVNESIDGIAMYSGVQLPYQTDSM